MRPHHCQSITVLTNLTYLRSVAKFRVLKQKRLFVKAVTWPSSTQHFSQEVALHSSQEMMLEYIPCQSSKTISVKSKLSTQISKQQRNNIWLPRIRIVDQTANSAQWSSQAEQLLCVNLVTTELEHHTFSTTLIVPILQSTHVMLLWLWLVTQSHHLRCISSALQTGYSTSRLSWAWIQVREIHRL